jgi:hypothetical protein
MWTVRVVQNLIEHYQAKERYVPLILGLTTTWVSAKPPNKWKALYRRQAMRLNGENAIVRGEMLGMMSQIYRY